MLKIFRIVLVLILTGSASLTSAAEADQSSEYVVENLLVCRDQTHIQQLVVEMYTDHVAYVINLNRFTTVQDDNGETLCSPISQTVQIRGDLSRAEITVDDQVFYFYIVEIRYLSNSEAKTGYTFSTN